MIAAVAISHIQSLRQANQNVGIAYVFYSYKAKLEQSASNILAALLKQLARPQSDIADSVMRMYDEHKKIASTPSLDGYSRALQAACSNYSVVHIIVDALDECSTPRGARDQLIDRLLALQASSGIKVRLLFTSRPLPEVTQRFRTASRLEIRARVEDVRTYVRGHMQTLPDCVWSNQQLSLEVEEKIAEAVDGMFLLARLYVESLADMITPKEVRQKLACLRNDKDYLDLAYKDAMQRINGQPRGRRQLARRAISWITFAQRLLTIEELRHALAIEPGEKALDYDNLSSVKDIVSACAGLVTTDDESGIVRLVHYTTEEFFERERTVWFPEAQSEIATACLTYLCFETFRAGACDNPEAVEKKLAENKFLDYSASLWVEHARPVQQTIDSELVRTLLGNTPLVNNLVQATLVTQYRRYDIFGPGYSWSSGLHLAVRHGLDVFVNVLLTDSKIKVDLMDESGQTPLSYAAEEGYEAVVELLLATGQVDADSQDSLGTTPLSYAAEGGYKAVVKLLLATGQVNADLKDSYGITPLSYAAGKGHEAVVKLLLSTGQVDADSSDEDSRTPLSHAAENGYEEVVKILLGTDQVDVDSRDKDGRTPLSYAAEGGHEVVVQSLLATDQVHVDSKDRNGQTPLSHAACSGHKTVSQILLATNQVEADSQDKNARTSLSYASWGGHPGVVQTLLATGQVDPNSSDKKGQTPLSYAAAKGCEEAVKILLDTGQVEADLKDKHGLTPLFYAIQRGDLEVAEILIATGQVETISTNILDDTPIYYTPKCTCIGSGKDPAHYKPSEGRLEGCKQLSAANLCYT